MKVIGIVIWHSPVLIKTLHISGRVTLFTRDHQHWRWHDPATQRSIVLGAKSRCRGAGVAFPSQSEVGAMSRSSGNVHNVWGGGDFRFPSCFFSCNAIGLMFNFAKVEGRLHLLTRPLFSGLWQCQSLVRCLSGTYPV